MQRGGGKRRGVLVVLVALLGGQLMFSPGTPATAQTTLPPGFVLQDTPTGQGQYNLTDFAYLPDGSVLAAGKNGRVTWVPVGGAPRTIARLATDPTGDLGLVGLAPARDYGRTRQVYVVRSVPTSAPPWVIRLSRFTVQGGGTPTGLRDESVLLEVRSAASVHGMTTVVPAPDGTLWVSVGDLQFATTVFPGALAALDLDRPAGKLLHIRPDGRGVATNPYYDPARPRSWRSRVFASGFRSPFRFSLDPVTGLPVLGDVGWRAQEELDVVTPGGSYGWPCWEGGVRTHGYSQLPGCSNRGTRKPLWSYLHGSGTTQGNAVVAGLVYEGDSYPQRYRGAFFFGDYTTSKLWTIRYDDQGRLVTAPEDPPLGVEVGAPVKFAAAPNGDIVYADLASGSLRRLTYTPGNTAPVARVDTSTDPSTRTVTFSARRSIDYDRDGLTYAWSFGDGATGSGVTARHRYDGPGDRFRATLTVTDPFGASGRVSVEVVPSNHTPALRLTKPAQGSFAVGEKVALSARGRDREDGRVRVTWRVAVLHCGEVSTCHLHPEAQSTGRTWEGRFPAHADATLQVTARARDSEGAVVTRTYVAKPRLRRLRLVSNTPAVLEVPGFAGGATARVTQGFTVKVVAAARAHDRLARFRGWRDGVGTRSRTVTVRGRDITLSARYLTPIGRRFAAERELRALLGRPRAPEARDGAVRYRRYEHGRLYWTPTTGVHEVHGRLLRAYLARGGGHGAMGVPVTDQRRTAAQEGRFVRFEKGAVYWSRATGAHPIHGPIWRRWSELGSDRSPLGLPTTGVVEVDGGAVVDFQNGSIRWVSATGRTVVRRS